VPRERWVSEKPYKTLYEKGGWVVVRYSIMHERTFSTGICDEEYTYIEPHVLTPSGHGQPKTHSPRELLNATSFYVLRGGCQ
jgi:hypothetical protein